MAVAKKETTEDINKMTAAQCRTAYRKIKSGSYCHECDEFKSKDKFYKSIKTKSGLIPTCKSCLYKIGTGYDEKTKKTNETRETIIAALRKADLPFIEDLYKQCCEAITNEVSGRKKETVFSQIIVCLQSLPQYSGMTFEDSEFLDDEDGTILSLTSKRKPRKEIIKLFGSGFTTEDYLYLQDQYDDWCARTEVDSKSQQTYIVRICFKLLDIYKAQKAGKDTEKLDRSLNDLLAAANLQPRQNVGNASTDTLTFSQLIQKWELDAPVPTPDPELCDVSGIGKKIRVWFGGWLANALGMDIPQSQEYLEEVEKYTVRKPELEEKGNNSEIYNKMFGSEE